MSYPASFPASARPLKLWFSLGSTQAYAYAYAYAYALTRHTLARPSAPPASLTLSRLPSAPHWPLRLILGPQPHLRGQTPQIAQLDAQNASQLTR